MKKRVLAVTVAFALAAVGCLAVVAYVRGADQRAMAGRKAAWVLVAAKRIPAGTTGSRIRGEGYVQRVMMPAQTLPKNALGEVSADLDTLAVNADVQPEQLLLRGMFAEPAALTGGLALPEGRMAVTVETTTASQVAGFVKPGATVAVFATYTGTARGRGPDKNGTQQVSRVVLPRVEVIAVGEQGTPGAVAGAAQSPAAETSGKKKSTAATLVTVAVTQLEAERLILAQSAGELQLALLDDTARIEPGAGTDYHTMFP